jgi:hypothetical protein
MDNLNNKLSDEAQSQPSCLGAVISWVAVSERLPEIPSENYLVVKNGIVGISLYRGDWNKFQCDLHDIQEVTHWAECPKPPCL